MITRRVEFVEDEESNVGAWTISCAECPLAPHLEALGMKRRACVAGIITNAQGPVPLKECEHFEKDSLSNAEENGEKVLTLRCGKEGA